MYLSLLLSIVTNLSVVRTPLIKRRDRRTDYFRRENVSGGGKYVSASVPIVVHFHLSNTTVTIFRARDAVDSSG